MRGGLPLTLLLVGAALAVTLAAGSAAAEESLAPTLKAQAIDLLPFDVSSRATFTEQHGRLFNHSVGSHREWLRLRAELAKTQGEARPALEVRVRRAGVQTSALLVRLTEALVAFGVEGSLIAHMNHAPAGSDRVVRYAHSLVLLEPDLTPTQRALFEHVHAGVDAARNALQAQRERTLLAVGQSGLDEPQQRGLARTFDRQLQIIDQRYWMLVDHTLSVAQRAWIGERLPQPLRTKSQEADHLYELSGLEPNQAARLRALLTEVEQERAPDLATVRRLGAQSDTPPDAAERQRIAQERGAAYGRLAALDRYRHESLRAILSATQWCEFVAIPPRVATGDRAGNYRRLFEGWEPTTAQAAAIQQFRTEGNAARRAARSRIAAMRAESGTYGPDSPQMMSMEMAMTGARAEQGRLEREVAGHIFLNIMTPDEVSRWVLGHWGYKP
ncbi:MAG: hypothetical protein O2894_06950 [Planctomycetota bacterium]|nr:hypothetical protein [Planctomycetota bacterium]